MFLYLHFKRLSERYLYIKIHVKVKGHHQRQKKLLLHSEKYPTRPSLLDIIIIISRRRSGSDLVGKIRLFNKDIELSTQVKYLGVILESMLSWIAHVEDRAQKALTAFWICKNYRQKQLCGYLKSSLDL